MEAKHIVVGVDASGTSLAAAHWAARDVVGSRGHGGFTGLMLGSVGQQLLHHSHSHSPVLIARPRPQQ